MSDSSTASSSTTSPIPALKERAGVVNALVDGAQTLLVRHPTLDPGTIDERFALYPAYSHQVPARYQPRYEEYYHRASAKPDDGVPVRAVADVHEEYTVPVSSSEDALDALARHYVYTPDGLRDKYDPDGELRVCLLRVSELENPTLLEERGSYRGCRAWIELADDVEVDPASATPVLDDATFAERRAAVRDALDRA
ncbi:DUF1802 family protein [Natronolimnohabitans innermongolicus]|uniref:DUF1802 domain-containing protein n=1 Tax=Natronolimnohabitans innermongolicus JCM 12255 TaxID=1227499 RepID=L9XGN5_9EURY|nr:DUF1802 family protein [Natronolimnohabitans innermongolicus]ELY60777.1 hypothetical protein C493_03707 [Natronolimnohabitans innermongolicus JCM 12255]